MIKTIPSINRLALIVCMAALLTGCTSAATPPAASADVTPASTSASAQMANPASENCVKQGGTLSIQKRGDGGEYGVCLFEDNRQCEEWALMGGECPPGGLKITGYLTQAAQYCVITGGQYTITGADSANQEEGSCTFKSGNICKAADYFNGTCDASSKMETYNDPAAYCAAMGNIAAPDARYTGEKFPDSLVQALVEHGVVTADAPKDFQRNAVWRCMNSTVWACHFGANLPCLEKADASQTITAEMQTYCADNPAADSIPANVTGRATVFEWKCSNGKPEAARQIFKIDAQGFIADFWYELTPQ